MNLSSLPFGIVAPDAMLCPPPFPPSDAAASRRATARSTPDAMWPRVARADTFVWPSNTERARTGRVAAVHVRLEVLCVDLIRLDPVAVLDDRVERLGGGSLLHEVCGEHRRQLPPRRGLELTEAHVGIQADLFQQSGRCIGTSR